MKNTIPCIIIDDDQTAIDVISDHIAEMPRLKIQKTYTKPVLALGEMIEEHTSQLIFMDIDMPAMSGIGLAESLKCLPHNIIFTTSYPEYALEAFKVRAKHYLLKPFNLGDFAKVVNEVIFENYDTKTLEREEDDAFYFRTDLERGKLTKVMKQEIVYIQGSNNHVHIYTMTEDYSVYMTTREMVERLSDKKEFFRVHKSYILNSTFVKRIKGNTIDLGKYQVLMTPVYNAEFMAYIERNTLTTKRT